MANGKPHRNLIHVDGSETKDWFSVYTLAEVILLDSRDAGYNNFMLKNAPKETGEVIFIDVGELAPVRSRLQHPKIVSRPHPMA